MEYEIRHRRREEKLGRARAYIVYKVLFPAFVIIGSSMQLGSVIEFSDAVIFAMAFPNIIGIYFLLPVVKREMNE